MTTDANENENLSGAHALNALSAEERVAYEAFLAQSQEARNEATELADTAVILGLAAEPVTPSPQLRASILDQIARTPQLSRDDAQDAAPAASTPATRKAEARWFQRPAVAIASLAAAVAIIAGGVSVVSDFGSTSSNPAASQMEQLTLASDKQEAVVEVGDATATLLWSNSLGLSALAMDGASEAPEGKVYQLWYIDDNGARDAGVMTASVDDGSWQVLEGEMRAGDAVGVTVEPVGGSEKPTSMPIVVIKS